MQNIASFKSIKKSLQNNLGHNACLCNQEHAGFLPARPRLIKSTCCKNVTMSSIYFKLQFQRYMRQFLRISVLPSRSCSTIVFRCTFIFNSMCTQKSVSFKYFVLFHFVTTISASLLRIAILTHSKRYRARISLAIHWPYLYIFSLFQT